jgi:nucleotide-binding universal stress UspA family protein
MLLWNLVPRYRDRVSQEATELVLGEVGLLSGVRAEVSSAIRLGSAPSEVLRLAREESADLIITGAQGHTAAGEVLLGSVSQQVAANAGCSVLVARGRGRPRRLLMAYDGSPDAEAAVGLLAWLRPPKDAEVTVVSVAEPAISVFGGEAAVPESFEGVREWRRTEARKHAQRAARRLRSAGWAATARAPDGHPANVLLKTVRETATDLILIGARGVHSPDDEVRGMGGIPRQVLERAGCSVLIARAPRAIES